MRNRTWSVRILSMRVGAFEVSEPVPELHNTRAIAILRPWVDVGRVGTLALAKVEQHLGAKELGRLARPGHVLRFHQVPPPHAYRRKPPDHHNPK